MAPPSKSCPSCGSWNDGSTCPEDPGARPKAGDIGICFSCRAICIYADDEMNVREPTDAELVEMAGDPALICATDAVAELQAELSGGDAPASSPSARENPNG